MMKFVHDATYDVLTKDAQLLFIYSLANFLWNRRFATTAKFIRYPPHGDQT